MSAIIILLPSSWDACPCDVEPPFDHQNERVDLNQFLGGRPPRSKPCLVYDHSRVVSDDDFHGGPKNAA